MSQTLISFLRKVEIFEDLAPHLIEQIVERSEQPSFQAGESIIRQGEAGEEMYILLTGKVLIPVRDAQGRSLYTSELQPGQIFGEMALLTGHPRSSDVIATEDCTCLTLSKKIVEHLMRTYPDIAHVLTAIVSERVGRAGVPQKVGKYTILKELARGSMAIVYEGIHPELERPLAIKMLHHELVYRPQFAERFRDEAKILAHLRHPHIVEVFDLEEAYATFFIIMEKIKGKELQHLISTQGQLSAFETRRILHQLLNALQFAHEQGVIHRDLKPSNIMIDGAGRARLMDFGIALLPHNKERHDEENLLLGTPYFMAPEQHTNTSISAAVDLYAMGLIAYNMLTGKPPFHGSLKEIEGQKRKRKFIDIHETHPDVPEDLASFIKETTRQEPGARPQEAREAASLLESVTPKGYELSQITAQTLTFVYPPHQQQVVRAILEKCKKKIEALPQVAAHAKFPDGA